MPSLKSNPPMIERDFDLIRLLLDSNVAFHQIVKISQRSNSTIALIKKEDFKTFIEYRTFITERNKKMRAELKLKREASQRKIPMPQKIVNSPTPPAATDVGLIKVLQNSNDFMIEANLQLAKIQDKLKAIIDKLEWLENHAVVDTSRYKRWMGKE